MKKKCPAKSCVEKLLFFGTERKKVEDWGAGNKLEFAEWFLFFLHALQFDVVKFCALSETNVEVAKREKSSSFPCATSNISPGKCWKTKKNETIMVAILLQRQSALHSP